MFGGEKHLRHITASVQIDGVTAAKKRYTSQLCRFVQGKDRRGWIGVGTRCLAPPFQAASAVSLVHYFLFGFPVVLLFLFSAFCFLCRLYKIPFLPAHPTLHWYHMRKMSLSFCLVCASCFWAIPFLVFPWYCNHPHSSFASVIMTAVDCFCCISPPSSLPCSAVLSCLCCSLEFRHGSSEL